ncbi:dynamin family protein [Evansella sp. AB-P1]|uniref:dynamin family protein n=1 Tax=Evansella sp. AB-P1 TaxID=3037653 RepID=UPI00241F6BB3|nr:dynamin family protein [Evansella sp. AB-P1]MDG5789328.1 dynamin family protein [Evansella sp. AB-P1]
MRSMKEMEQVVKGLKKYGHMLPGHYEELVSHVKRTKENVKDAKEKNRCLRIGIVGQVNAGKSSFINTLVFQGKGVLPKAATPMTAALTVLTYSDELKAELEFYNKEEWQRIEEDGQHYDEILVETKERLAREQRDRSGNGGRFGRSEVEKPITEEQVKRAAIIPEHVKAAKTIVQMVKKSGLKLENYLGAPPKVIKGITVDELIGKLEKYVGAEGEFTPIVRNSTVYYNDPLLKDIEIIDTPGLNDPVLSRGRRTKDNLGICDVVFVLSYAGSFIDKVDVQLLAQYIPSNGINEIILIGTKLDAVLRQEFRKFPSIGELLDTQEDKLERLAERTFHHLADQCDHEGEKQIIDRVIQSLPPIFISSMAFNIATNWGSLSKEEAYHLNSYNAMYPHEPSFDRELLYELSNLELAHEKLEEQRRKKDDIIASRIQSITEGASEGFDQLLRKMKEAAEQRMEQIRSGDVDLLQEKEKAIVGKIQKGRYRLETVFESCVLKVKSDFSMLETDMKGMAREFQTVNIKTGSEMESYEVSAFELFKPKTWFKKKTEYRAIPYDYANVYDSIDQVEEFATETERRLKELLLGIVNKDKMKGELRQAALSLFDLSDESFEVEDVVIPVEKTINRLNLPEIDFGNKDYTGIITKHFNEREIRNDAIMKLENAQRQAIKEVLKDMQASILKKTKEISGILERAQQDFVRSILSDIEEDLQQLQGEIKNKEKSLKEYGELVSVMELAEGRKLTIMV